MALSRSVTEAVGGMLESVGLGAKKKGSDYKTYTKTNPDTTKYIYSNKDQKNTTKVSVPESSQYYKDTGEKMEE